MRDNPFTPHGTNWQWAYHKVMPGNDRMRENFRFRCGLTRCWPPSNFQPQN